MRSRGLPYGSSQVFNIIEPASSKPSMYAGPSQYSSYHVVDSWLRKNTSEPGSIEFTMLWEVTNLRFCLYAFASCHSSTKFHQCDVKMFMCEFQKLVVLKFVTELFLMSRLLTRPVSILNGDRFSEGIIRLLIMFWM